MELQRVRDDVLGEMKVLKAELRRLILDGDEARQNDEFEILDLAPFIPGFMSNLKNTPKAKKAGPSELSNLPPQVKHAKSGKMNTDRAETLILVE